MMDIIEDIGLRVEYAKAKTSLSFESWKKLHDIQCDICGEYHEGNVPYVCETGDGI